MHAFLTNVLVAVVFGLVGFGVGRIKNAAKLAAINLIISKVETLSETDLRNVLADIQKHL